MRDLSGEGDESGRAYAATREGSPPDIANERVGSIHIGISSVFFILGSSGTGCQIQISATLVARKIGGAQGGGGVRMFGYQ